MTKTERCITLTETHTPDGIYYNWTLQSRKHFWFKRISMSVYNCLWSMLALRSFSFRCLPGEKIDRNHTIFETEFYM